MSKFSKRLLGMGSAVAMAFLLSSSANAMDGKTHNRHSSKSRQQAGAAQADRDQGAAQQASCSQSAQGDSGQTCGESYGPCSDQQVAPPPAPWQVCENPESAAEHIDTTVRKDVTEIDSAVTTKVHRDKKQKRVAYREGRHHEEKYDIGKVSDEPLKDKWTEHEGFGKSGYCNDGQLTSTVSVVETPLEIEDTVIVDHLDVTITDTTVTSRDRVITKQRHGDEATFADCKNAQSDCKK